MSLDTKLTFAQQLAHITEVDREADYGHPLNNFTSTALQWTGYFQPKLLPKTIITPVDIGMAQILAKVSREQHRHKFDNILDTAGYASTISRIDDKLVTLGFVEGVRIFETMDIS